MSPVGSRAEFELRLTATGMQAVLAALKRIGHQVNVVTTQTKTAKTATNELGRSFRNIALRTVAYLGIVRGLRAVTTSIRKVVSAGIEYNEVIEQSRLGIASLISAQADLVTANERQLEGVEKLDAAYELATDQVRKLRIAGIQTAATTKELVDAFQQAVGAGIASGLNLDEIRKVTIRIAQAAGALGVPYRQLNEEIRSILGGIIDQNTRIAKALQIKNEQVRLAREENRLADFLLEKFSAFGDAGERIVETWGALRSNIAEAFELLAGEATFPLFEEVRTRGLTTLARVFDFDTAEISREFAQIVRQLQQVFGGIGEQLAGTIEGAVDAAARLNDWLIANRDEASLIADTFGEVVSGFAEMISSWARVNVGLVQAGVEMGIIAQYAETVADTFKTIGRNRFLSAITQSATLGLILTAIFKVLGGKVAIVTGIVAALGGLVSALDAMTQSAAEAADEITRLRDAEATQLTEAASATESALTQAREYDELAEALRENRVASEGVVDVQNRMKGIITTLTRLSPEYAAVVRAAILNEKTLEEAVYGVMAARIAEAEAQIAANDALAQGAKDRIAEITDLLSEEGNWFDIFIARDQVGRTNLENELVALNDQLESLEVNSDEARAAIARLQQILAGEAITVVGPEGEDGGNAAADALKRARAGISEELARIKSELKRREAELKSDLDANLLNYAQYYDELDLLQQTAFREQIALYERLAELEKDDPQRAAAARSKALQLETDARVASLKNETARRAEGLKFAQEAAQLEAQLLQQVGDIGEATAKRLEAQYADTIAKLEAMGEYGQEQIDKIRLFQTREVARAELQELEDEIARAQQRIRDRVQEIQLQVDVGNLGENQGRLAIANEYEQLYALIQELLPEMRALAAVIEDPAAAEQVEELASQMRQLGVEVDQLRDAWKDFRDDVARAIESNLADYLSDAVIEAESLSDAVNNLVGSLENFRNLLGSIVADIVRAISQMIALKIVQASFKAVGLPIPTYAEGGEVKKFASGGFIQGPGTATSDSILARLSDGEYVVRAAAVQKYGTTFLNDLNRGALPRDVRNLRSYATGGLVSGSSNVVAAKEFRGELTIGLGDGLVVDQLDTPSGERLILKVINKNRRNLLGA